jgi:hypothetical protein
VRLAAKCGAFFYFFIEIVTFGTDFVAYCGEWFLKKKIRKKIIGS